MNTIEVLIHITVILWVIITRLSLIATTIFQIIAESEDFFFKKRSYVV